LNYKEKYEMEYGGSTVAIKAPNIKVQGARVLVLQDPAEQTINGIILPEQSQQKHKVGTVVAVGNGLMTFNGERIPMEVEVGDRVVWADLGGVPVQVDDTEYLVINQNHILAVIGKEEVETA
jgi:chaperonin GroES